MLLTQYSRLVCILPDCDETYDGDKDAKDDVRQEFSRQLLVYRPPACLSVLQYVVRSSINTYVQKFSFWVSSCGMIWRYGFADGAW
jgi:hypothetical protein